MSRLPICLSAVLCLGGATLAAQERTLGLNFTPIGTTQVGVTWVTSSSLTLRPFVQASWNKSSSPFGDTESSL